MTDPNCKDCYGDGIIVHATGDIAWEFCHCYVPDPIDVGDDPDPTLINRRSGYRQFPPPDLCEMCGGSLIGGIRPCVCKVQWS